MRFRAPRRLPASAALVAALLIALPGLANAADEADANNQPVEEQGASKEAGASEETRPCFTGKGSVKEVLELLRRDHRQGLERHARADQGA